MSISADKKFCIHVINKLNVNNCTFKFIHVIAKVNLSQKTRVRACVCARVSGDP